MKRACTKRIITLTLLFLQIVLLLCFPTGTLASAAPYQETVVPIPEGYNILTMSVAPDGAIFMLAQDQEGANCLLHWKGLGDMPEVIPLPLTDVYVNSMSIAADGEILLCVMERISDPDAKEMIFANLFIWMDASGQETGRFSIDWGSDYYPNIIALPGKRIATMDWSYGDGEVAVYEETGREAFRTQSRDIFSILADNTTLYAFGDGGNVFAWSLDTYAKMPTQPFSWRYFSNTVLGADGKIYMADQNGLFELDLAKGDAVKRMEPLGTYLGDSSYYTAGFGIMPDGAFILLARGTNPSIAEDGTYTMENALAIYRQLDEIDSRKPFVITRMHEGDSPVSRAASEFQRAHPELAVELRTLNSYQTGGVVQDDLVRVINTELMAGGGGDVLLLDYMPIKNIFARGLLRDLSHMMGDVGLLPGIAEGSKHSDGKVYAIPAEFSVTFLWGRKDVIDSIHAFEDIMNVPLAPDQLRLPYSFNLPQFIASCMKDFVDDKGEFSFRSDGFIALLETVYEIYGEMDVSYDTDYRVLYQAERDALTEGNIAFYPDWTYGFFSMSEYYTAFGEEEAGVILMPSIRTPGQAYEPKILVGIPTSAKDPALSEEFLRLALSEEMSILGYFNTFSTVEKTLDKVFELEIERNQDERRGRVIHVRDGKEYVFNPPSEVFMQHMRALLDGLAEPVDIDSTIQQFIMEELPPFLEGKITAAAVADAIEQRAWLYLHE